MSCRLLTLFLLIAVAAALKAAPRTHSAVVRRAAEQDIKDLNLEEMFEVFDKADKTVKGGATNTAAVRAVKPTGERSASVPYLPRPKNLDGLVGNKGFDPIGFSDFISPSWLREAELKHGRIAMLATAGWVFTYYHNPVLSVGPLEAHNAAVASGAAWQVLAAIAGAEFVGSVALKATFDGKRAAGDFGFDPLNFYGKLDSKGKETMQLKELENGRLGMMAFSGIVTASAAFPGESFPGYGAF